VREIGLTLDGKILHDEARAVASHQPRIAPEERLDTRWLGLAERGEEPAGGELIGALVTPDHGGADSRTRRVGVQARRGSAGHSTCDDAGEGPR